jgi:beta-lactamase class A
VSCNRRSTFGRPAVARSTTTRRAFALGASLVAAGGAQPAGRGDARIAAIEAEYGGRLGVSAWDIGSGARIAYRADERFAMCSTFKAPLAAAILARVDQGRIGLGELLAYGEEDLLPTSPVTAAHVAKGSLAVETLCAAVVEVSDNCAANLLLKRLGGPAAFTAWLRGQGDRMTRLDRTELELNTNLPGDPRDTTTPAAMRATLQKLVVGSALKPASRERLAGWMVTCATGLDRLRAGLPGGWRAGDKTGTGANGAHNDIAVAWPPGRRPIVIVSYFTEAPGDAGKRSRALADVGRLVASAFS